MTTILRLIAWLLAAAVIFATLGPAGLRPHAPLGHDGEHAFAFVPIGLAFGLAYARVAAIAVAMIGVLGKLEKFGCDRDQAVFITTAPTGIDVFL